MARKLKKEMSEQRKMASIKQWAIYLKMDPEETSRVLTEKYGPYAYDVMENAMMRPSVLMKCVGEKAGSSKEAVQYFIKNIVSDEVLAKGVNAPVEKVRLNITKYRLENPLPEETPEQKEIRERQEQFNKHFNEEKKGDESTELTVDPAKVDISQMTLEDYVKYCDPEDKPAKDYNDLVEKAYEDFGKGEGVIQKLYLDSKGYPTIGNGHLVLHPDYLKNSNSLKSAKLSYMNIPLMGANGKPLTLEQKSVQFSQIVDAYKKGNFRTSGGCPNYVLSPQTGRLNESGVKAIFKQDFKNIYNRTKEVVPNIDKMPLPVQMAVLHCTFAYGNARRLRTVDVNNPAELVDRVKELRGKRCSRGERSTIKNANDSIQNAQDGYKYAKIKYAELQKLLNEDVELIAPQKTNSEKLKELTFQKIVSGDSRLV